MSDVGGDVISANSQHHCVPDIAVNINSHVSRPAANIYNGDTHLAFGFPKGTTLA